MQRFMALRYNFARTDRHAHVPWRGWRELDAPNHAPLVLMGWSQPTAEGNTCPQRAASSQQSRAAPLADHSALTHQSPPRSSGGDAAASSAIT